HPRVAIGAAVVHRQRGRQHHKVENVCSCRAAEHREHMHERAAAVGIARCIQINQQRIPWGQRQQDHQRTDVKNKDAVDHLIDRFGNDGSRLIGFGRGEPQHFQTAERKHDEGQGHHQTAHTIGEEPTVVPQVTDGGLRTAATTDQHVTAQRDHPQNGHDLDDREPELRLAEDFDVGQVDDVDHQEEHSRRRPGRDFRPPVLNVFSDRAGRNDRRGAGCRVVQPFCSQVLGRFRRLSVRLELLGAVHPGRHVRADRGRKI
nr:hypothetical protein [Tanacetum cinerariifolium]